MTTPNSMDSTAREDRIATTMITEVESFAEATVPELVSEEAAGVPAPVSVVLDDCDDSGVKDEAVGLEEGGGVNTELLMEVGVGDEVKTGDDEGVDDELIDEALSELDSVDIIEDVEMDELIGSIEVIDIEFDEDAEDESEELAEEELDTSIVLEDTGEVVALYEVLIPPELDDMYDDETDGTGNDVIGGGKMELGSKDDKVNEMTIEKPEDIGGGVGNAELGRVRTVENTEENGEMVGDTDVGTREE
ncbi:hypothetical protein NLI96_g10286 [Meripilus lineatus]|uniref:Uncharacterized protein n=1 Tax=Meripilus lineatus TaxID=2056292 RepID=A0AAD5UYI8_9APHY|nr:hypothetical protein NLI96_g10286 [Physisporinus lineatus]